jgi:hypothetical protein
MIRSIINRIHDRWANHHPLVRFLVGALVVGGIGLFALKPAYRGFKAWRLDRNLVAAREAVDDARMDEARDLSLTVLRAGDPRIEAFRILEKSTATLRDPLHSGIARALIGHPEGTREDRLNGFRGIAQDIALGLVGQSWASLPEDCQQDPRFAVAFAERLIMEKRLSEAVSMMLSVPEGTRDPEIKRSLIRALIASGKGEALQEAQRQIATSFPASPQSESAEWLKVLEEIPPVGLQASLLTPVRSLLEGPEFKGQAQSGLMIARMDYAAQFARRAAVVDAAVERWKEPSPELVARFLQDLGLNQRLLDEFPPERVIELPGLFPYVLDASEKTGAWDQVLLLLDKNGHLLTKLDVLAHRAIALGGKGESGGFNQTWSAAIEEAKANPDGGSLMKLYRIANEFGLEEAGNLALLDAIRLGRGPLPLYSDLKPLLGSLQEQRRENTLLEVCANYFSFEPGNPVLLTQYAYLACLNQLAEPAMIVKALEPLAKAFPKELPIQCVLAMVYLCDGKPEKAAEALDGLNLDPSKLAPSYRAVYLVSQVLNRRMSKNDPQVVDFPWQSLQASERRRFTELIRSAVP